MPDDKKFHGGWRPKEEKGLKPKPNDNPKPPPPTGAGSGSSPTGQAR